MASAPFLGTASPLTNLTGNSVYVFDTNGVLWLLVATESGAAIYASSDKGNTFDLMQMLPTPSTVPLAFDPAIAIDTNNVLHILGQVQKASASIALVLFRFDTVGGGLSGPIPVASGSLDPSDYDLVALADGSSYVAWSPITTISDSLIGVQVSDTGALSAFDTYASFPEYGGLRYGSVSLLSPDGVSVELWWNRHPKQVPISGFTEQVGCFYRGADASLSPPTVFLSFPARHIDNRLTVLASGASRYLSLCYYTQQKAQLASSALLGYLPDTASSWDFFTLVGTGHASFLEPVLSLGSAGLTLSYLQRDWTTLTAKDSHVAVVAVDPVSWSFTPLASFHTPTEAQFLRGTKSPLPLSMPWGFMAQTSTGMTRFFTGYDAPPTAILLPTELNGVRDQLYNLDASRSFSLSQDALQFAWLVNDPTGVAVFSAAEASASLLLPMTAGPEAVSLSVTVTVTATDAKGTALHAPVPATLEVNYPAVPPPVITAESTIPVARNTVVPFTPTVASGAPVYVLWEQVGGTPVEMESDPTATTLVFRTHGAAVLGETLQFELTVSDHMNAEVVEVFSFAVSPRKPDGVTTVLSRSTWSGVIAERNTPGEWSLPVTSAETTNFERAYRSNLIGGGWVYLLISSSSVLVTRNTVAGQTSFHVYLPDATDTILDASVADYDATLVLTAAGNLVQIGPNTLGTDTDNAQATLALSNVTAKRYTRLRALSPCNGTRVLALWGNSGALLLATDTRTLTVVESLEVSMAAGLLYGADAVNFLRTSGVENLHTGELLLGTTDAAGNSYETVVALPSRSILRCYDSSELISTQIVTGEILFAPDDSYAGMPLAPVQAPAVASPDGCLLSWTQVRPDLVTAYNILSSEDGGVYSFLLRVGAGETTSTTVTGLAPGVRIFLVIQAVSNDGLSAYSNRVSVIG